jgi:hypothetical protein
VRVIVGVGVTVPAAIVSPPETLVQTTELFMKLKHPGDYDYIQNVHHRRVVAPVAWFRATLFLAWLFLWV